MIDDVLRVVLGFAPSSRRIKKDLERMRQETQDWFMALIPWQEEKEMELLSLNNEKKWVKQTWDKFQKGVFQSIYNEPMFTYAYKSYTRSGKDALLLVRTKEHEYLYRIRKKRTDVIVDGKFVAVITPEAQMYSASSRRLLARISQVSSEYFGVFVWEKEVGHLLNPDKVDRVNPRAFLILEKLDENEELLFLSISLIEVVLRTNKLL